MTVPEDKDAETEAEEGVVEDSLKDVGHAKETPNSTVRHTVRVPIPANFVIIPPKVIKLRPHLQIKWVEALGSATQQTTMTNEKQA